MGELSMIHQVDIYNAALPEVYEKAKLAIAECAQIDECKDWADKAQALASYARQASDEELEQTSKRIRARAMRRCGELLKLLDGRNGQNLPTTKKDGNDHFNKSEAAREVGLSERQEKTATRLANIPEERFNEQIEAPKVPTLTALSEEGKKERKGPKLIISEEELAHNQEILSRPKPRGFLEAAHFNGKLEQLYSLIKEHPPELIINGMLESQKPKAIKKINEIDIWFDQFVIKCQHQKDSEQFKNQMDLFIKKA